MKPKVQYSLLPDRIDSVKPAVHWFVEEHVDHLLNHSAHKSRFYTDRSQFLKLLSSQLAVSVIAAENSHGECIFLVVQIIVPNNRYYKSICKEESSLRKKTCCSRSISLRMFS